MQPFKMPLDRSRQTRRKTNSPCKRRPRMSAIHACRASGEVLSAAALRVHNFGPVCLGDLPEVAIAAARGRRLSAA
jgi:hypothetical protein